MPTVSVQIVAASEDVDQDEPPRQGVAVLDLAERPSADEQDPEQDEPPRAAMPGSLAPLAGEEDADHEEADPEDGGDAHVDVDGVRRLREPSRGMSFSARSAVPRRSLPPR